MMSTEQTDPALFADPRKVEDAGTCYFYHTLDLPGHGVVRGDWDLRENVSAYLGEVDFHDKRVLEMGPASGFLSFEMERRGAVVTAYDLCEEQTWDVVPFDGLEVDDKARDKTALICKMNDGFWFAHGLMRSDVKVVYGSVYAMPDGLGQFEIATFGCILLHLRDPFTALYNALRHTTETALVMDLHPDQDAAPLLNTLLPSTEISGKPVMEFIPNRSRRSNPYAWWLLSTACVRRFLDVLGFDVAGIMYHRHCLRGESRLLYTLVAHRVTAGVG